jgi:hypothetical protein
MRAFFYGAGGRVPCIGHLHPARVMIPNPILQLEGSS